MSENLSNWADYEDYDDADTLRTDPVLMTVVGRAEALASQPTLSRHPLFFFEGHTKMLLSARLRPGNALAAAETCEELCRLVPILRERFPHSQLSYRADAASAMPEIYHDLEEFKLRYAIGMASNSAFKRKITRWLERCERKYARTKQAVRRYYGFRHRARSWKQQRRILVKIEVGPLGTNVRFVVTNRPGRPEEIFQWYEHRGECENHIKEFKRDLLHSIALGFARWILNRDTLNRKVS